MNLELSQRSLELAVLDTLGEDALVESGMEDFHHFVSAYINEPSDQLQRWRRLQAVWSVIANQRGKIYDDAFRREFGASFDVHGFCRLTEEQTVPINQRVAGQVGIYTTALDYLREHIPNGGL